MKTVQLWMQHYKSIQWIQSCCGQLGFETGVQHITSDHQNTDIHWVNHVRTRLVAIISLMKNQWRTLWMLRTKIEPSIADPKELYNNYLLHIQRILTKRFPSVEGLSSNVPKHIKHKHSEENNEKKEQKGIYLVKWCKKYMYMSATGWIRADVWTLLHSNTKTSSTIILEFKNFISFTFVLPVLQVHVSSVRKTHNIVFAIKSCSSFFVFDFGFRCRWV